jgi:hypothetical protein
MGLVRAAVACLALLVALAEAKAQGTPAAGYPATSSSNTGMGGMGMGFGFMPMPYGMFGSASPSATDAAALGMPAPSRIGMGMGLMPIGMGMYGSNNVVGDPMAAPMLYGSAYGMNPRQTGLMMLAGQSQMMGIGSGQLSGVRPGATTAARTRQQAATKKRGSASTPGGLAARYFNRTSGFGRYPQNFYNRQNQHFPQVAR